MNTSSGVRVETDYLELSIHVLRMDEIVDFDIYIQPGNKGPYVLYREKCLPFTDAAKARLEESNVEDLYVQRDQDEALRDYMERNLGKIVDDDMVAPEKKAEVVYDSLTWLTQNSLEDPRAPELVSRSEDIVQHTSRFLYHQPAALEHMIKVSSFDFTTYTHSVNVFVFALALGQRVFDESSVMNEFGLGALLHDIGKSRIDPAILNFRGRLSEQQFSIMKRHTVYGYEILKEKGHLHPLVLDMARHHHERIGGGGYPDNLKGSDVCRQVRVLTIADVFEALTSQRPYKKSMESFPALKMMRDEMSSHVDPELFRIFVQVMAKSEGSPSSS